MKSPFNLIRHKETISGIYFIFKGDDLLYIGQSINLQDRIYHSFLDIKVKHKISRKDCIFSFIEYEPHHLDEMEEYYINEYKPRLNVQMTVYRGKAWEKKKKPI